MPQSKPALTRPGMSLTWAQVVQSLEEFLDLLPHLDKYPELLARRFVWFGMRNKPLMTGYYTPEIEASLTRQPGYEFPIYGVPADLRYGRVRGRDRFYRVEQGRVRPYYKRGDMDVRHVLAGRGLEIAWAKDPLDVFTCRWRVADVCACLTARPAMSCTAQRTATDSEALDAFFIPRGCCPRADFPKGT